MLYFLLYGIIAYYYDGRLSAGKGANFMDYIFSDKISSLKPSAIREILKATSDPGVIPLAAGNPSAEAFPVEEVKKIKLIVSDVPSRSSVSFSLPSQL